MIPSQICSQDRKRSRVARAYSTYQICAGQRMAWTQLETCIQAVRRAGRWFWP